jgi:hypothetical protein
MSRERAKKILGLLEIEKDMSDSSDVDVGIRNRIVWLDLKGKRVAKG